MAIDLEIENSEQISSKDEKIYRGNDGLVNLLIEKSQEAFWMSIETYNNPRNNLKVESFCYYICTAWEMMLKAFFIKNGKSINYKDSKNKNRTFSLSDCVSKQFTNDKDPLRINLEIIIGIRNSATHLIIPEYAELLHGCFLSCINNYCSKLNELFGINIQSKIGNSFFNLFIPKTINKIDINNKYPNSVKRKYGQTKKFIENLIENSANSMGYANDKIALTYELRFKKVKNVTDADLLVANSNKDGIVKIVNAEYDPKNDDRTYSTKDIIKKVKDELKRQSITFIRPTQTSSDEFNQSTFILYVNEYNIKNNKEFALPHCINGREQYTYSLMLVQKIVNDISDNPEIFKNINLKNKKG